MKPRLISLDVLRGLNIILMTIVNNPGDWGMSIRRFCTRSGTAARRRTWYFLRSFLLSVFRWCLPLPVKNLNIHTLQKIITRTLRIFCLGLFLSFFSKINAFGLEGLPLLGIRLTITAIVVVALFSEYDRRFQSYVSVIVFLTMMILAIRRFC